jgi:hypothetical protein
METNQKIVLFFSNYCNFSKHVINVLTKKNLRHFFVLICVDSLPNIPKFVDRVPLIYVNNEVVVDDAIDGFIEKLDSQSHSRNIEPILMNEQFSSFQGLDATEGDLNGSENVQSTTSYMSLQQMDAFKIYTPSEENVGVKKSDSGTLEKYISQRENEYNLLKKQQQH